MAINITFDQLAALGFKVREAQRAYFKDRNQTRLVQSKVAEKELDSVLTQLGYMPSDAKHFTPELGL